MDQRRDKSDSNLEDGRRKARQRSLLTDLKICNGVCFDDSISVASLAGANVLEKCNDGADVKELRLFFSEGRRSPEPT